MPGGSRPSVDSQEPARISSSPAAAPAPGRSPRIVTPSATATTGATYVITAARPGPASAISMPKNTNAAAVQNRPSTTIATIAVDDGVVAGGRIAAAGASAIDARSRLPPPAAGRAGARRRRLGTP